MTASPGHIFCTILTDTTGRRGSSQQHSLLRFGQTRTPSSTSPVPARKRAPAHQVPCSIPLSSAYPLEIIAFPRCVQYPWSPSLFRRIAGTSSQCRRVPFPRQLKGLDSSSLPSLTALDVDGNRLRSLEGLRRLPSLVHLSLRRNLIGARRQAGKADGREESAAPVELPRLETVRLDCNSLRSLEALGPCRALCHMSAAHNLIASVPSLTQWPNLRLLDLSHNRVEMLDGIAELHGLAVLRLRGNRVRSLAEVTRCVPTMTTSFFFCASR